MRAKESFNSQPRRVAPPKPLGTKSVPNLVAQFKPVLLGRGGFLSPVMSQASVTCALAGRPLDALFRKCGRGFSCLRRAHPVCGRESSLKNAGGQGSGAREETAVERKIAAHSEAAGDESPA